MDYIEAVKRIRNEHPECGGLVMAKRLVDKYGSYEAAKAALTEGKPDPEVERAQEVHALRSALMRARGCIKGLLARTPVRDVEETLAEIDAALRS